LAFSYSHSNKIDLLKWSYLLSGYDPTETGRRTQKCQISENFQYVPIDENRRILQEPGVMAASDLICLILIQRLEGLLETLNDGLDLKAGKTNTSLFKVRFPQLKTFLTLQISETCRKLSRN
jgi:hypothetical protein